MLKHILELGKVRILTLRSLKHYHTCWRGLQGPTWSIPDHFSLLGSSLPCVVQSHWPLISPYVHLRAFTHAVSLPRTLFPPLCTWQAPPCLYSGFSVNATSSAGSSKLLSLNLVSLISFPFFLWHLGQFLIGLRTLSKSDCLSFSSYN